MINKIIIMIKISIKLKLNTLTKHFLSYYNKFNLN